jgi:hypothetical protein
MKLDSSRNMLFSVVGFLSLPAEKQLELNPVGELLAEDLANDFSHWLEVVSGMDAEFSHRNGELLQIDEIFEKDSNPSGEFWTLSAIRNHQKWERIRELARESMKKNRINLDELELTLFIGEKVGLGDSPRFCFMNNLDKYRVKYVGLSWISFFVIALILHLVPVRTGAIRFLLMGSWVVFLIGAVQFFKHWIFRSITIVCFLFVMSLALLSGRASDRLKMRQDYIQSLQDYEGTKYIWGGETFTGIDCSGLVRMALAETFFYTSIRTFNPELFRKAVKYWFFDSSAKALRDGHRNRTKQVMKAESIKLINYPLLEEGDLAVTTDGLHILAYIGEQKWIQADPSAGKVTITHKDKKNVWFDLPVIVLRWSIFATANYKTVGTRH